MRLAYAFPIPKLARLLSFIPVALVAAAFGPAATAGAQATQISWTDCPADAYPSPELAEKYPGLQCGTFEVPYDYSRPNGKKFTLALRKLPASGTKIGTLFTNPGGPGAPGRNMWSAPAQSASLRQSFDLVGFDPRAIGETKPAFDCFERAAGPQNTPNVDWVQYVDELALRFAKANRACQKKSADFIAHVGTNNVVRDLDAMRAAVGDSKLTYWGMSYGSRIGYVYAYRYPQRVRAILLDGSVAPDGSWADHVDVRSRSNDQALRFIRSVSPATYAAVISTRNSLFASPLDIGTAGNPLALGAYSWLDIVGARFLGRQDNWPQIIQLAKVVATARIVGSGGDEARAELRKLVGVGSGGPVIEGSFNAISCLDYADRPSRRERSRIVRNVVPRAPVFGGPTVSELAPACVGYTFQPDPVPQIASRASRARVRNVKLAISDSTADPGTPLVWARAMARAFPSAFEVTWVTGNHVNFLRPDADCVSDPVREYLLTLKMAPRRTTCPFTAPAGLDMSAVAPGTAAAGRRKVDPGAVVETILRNNRLSGR